MTRMILLCYAVQDIFEDYSSNRTKTDMDIVYGNLHHILQILDTEDVPVKQIIPCLAILLQKSENDIANIIKKTTQFCEGN